MKLRALIGSGDKIILFTLPFLIVAVILNNEFPSLFEVGGPPLVLRAVSLIMAVLGIVVWVWAVVLILTIAARGELITSGPFALVKHPLYTGVSLLVLPWAGLIFDSWLGVPVGIAMYIGSRIFSPQEETALSKAFGPAWEEYLDKVRFPWL